jgi:hypothetical protein
MDKFLDYLLLALSATTVLMGGLIASMVTRRRNLEKDLALLEELAKDDAGR